jgi:hypothetical protein
MEYDERHIEDLLEKFMDGRSSIEEEDELQAYFASEKYPAKWNDYASMFGYFAGGMKKLPEASRKPVLKRGFFIGLAAACLAGLLAGGFFAFNGSRPEESMTAEVQQDSTPVAEAESPETEKVQGPVADREVVDLTAETQEVQAAPVTAVAASPSTATAEKAAATGAASAATALATQSAITAPASKSAVPDSIAAEITRQVRARIIEMALAEARVRAFDEEMNSRGYVRMTNEDGSATYKNVETIETVLL